LWYRDRGDVLVLASPVPGDVTARPRY